MLYPNFTAKLRQNTTIYKISWKEENDPCDFETSDLTKALKVWFDLLARLASTHYKEDQLLTYVWHEATSDHVDYLLTHHDNIKVYYKTSEETIGGPASAKSLNWTDHNIVAFLIAGS
jgi:hypothetical protein